MMVLILIVENVGIEIKFDISVNVKSALSLTRAEGVWIAIVNFLLVALTLITGITFTKYHYLILYASDPSKKKFEIANKQNGSFETLKDELDKCDLVCANCHRIRTVKRAIMRGERKHQHV
jgi:hypothetical protein